MKPLSLLIAASIVLAAPLHAQERMGSAAPAPTYRAGWTLTPTFGFAETYDDNISLFGVNTAEEQNNDVVQTWFPGADLHYAGKHTQLGVGYTGSFLSYRTFSTLNRWDQRGSFELKREESARWKWSAHANAALVPSTDLIDLGGIPFSRTGARTSSGRASVEHIFSARDSIVGSVGYQIVDFDRPETLVGFLRGGRVIEGLAGWRHSLTSRLAVGADYSLRRATVVGDPEPFDLHSVQAAADYELSPTWSMSAAGGVAYLAQNALTDSITGPAWRISVDRHRAGRTFHVAYLRSYIPSFGFGGTIQSQEVTFGFHTPLFHSRRWYASQTAIVRDDTPITTAFQQLPLRSLRTYSILGWSPQPWVHIEAFYARTQQTSLRPGGELYRNRVGFQIVTSKPMRIQ